MPKASKRKKLKGAAAASSSSNKNNRNVVTTTTTIVDDNNNYDYDDYNDHDKSYDEMNVDLSSTGNQQYEDYHLTSNTTTTIATKSKRVNNSKQSSNGHNNSSTGGSNSNKNHHHTNSSSSSSSSHISNRNNNDNNINDNKTSSSSSSNNNNNKNIDKVWVQCNTCDKWRCLPSTVDADKLPDIWTCDLNTYDPGRMTCTAPEESYKDIEEEKNAPLKSFLKVWVKRLKCNDRAEHKLASNSLTRGMRCIRWCCWNINMWYGKDDIIIITIITISITHNYYHFYYHLYCHRNYYYHHY
jgi:hypothetical protein